MAYKQHDWVNGEIITAEKLNNMEAGIAETDTREIAASATATVENTTGEPSCEVTATGSTSAIAFKFAFKGIKGETGLSGEAAATPVLQKSEEAVQVSYDSGVTWKDLFQLADIKGDKGETGITPLLKKTDTAIQVSVDDGENWEDLIALEDIKGESAPTVTSQTINIIGNVISGTTYYSDGSETDITGVYVANVEDLDGYGESDGGDETPVEGGETPDAGDAGDGGDGGDGGDETPEEGGETPEGGDE